MIDGHVGQGSVLFEEFARLFRERDDYAGTAGHNRARAALLRSATAVDGGWHGADSDKEMSAGKPAQERRELPIALFLALFFCTRPIIHREFIEFCYYAGGKGIHRVARRDRGGPS